MDACLELLKDNQNIINIICVKFYHLGVSNSSTKLSFVFFLKDLIPSKLGIYDLLVQCHAFTKALPSPYELMPYASSICFIGIDVAAHDIRFVEDNWESPVIWHILFYLFFSFCLGDVCVNTTISYWKMYIIIGFFNKIFHY